MPSFTEKDLMFIRDHADVCARVSALQMIVEEILQKLDGPEYGQEKFRAHLESLKRMCYQQDLLHLEKTHPGLAALIDANRPLINPQEGEGNAGA